jgi:hypothetical protein
MGYKIPKAVCLSMVFLFILAVPAFAEWESNCTGNTLLKNTTYQVSGTLVPVNLTINCPGGCANNRIECNSPENVPPMFYMFFGVSMVISALVFAFIGSTLNKEDYPLGFAFLTMSLISMITLMGIFAGWSTAGQNEVSNVLLLSYYFTMIIFGFTIAYYLIKLFVTAIKGLLESRKEI